MIKINNQILDFETFPNGETMADGRAILRLLKDHGELNDILFRYDSDSDLIKLMFVKKHLDSIKDIKTILTIAYMPYSRMDRVDGYGKYLFTLKHVADFINGLGFDSVCIIEPHSDVTMALINNSHPRYATGFMANWVADEVGINKEVDYLMYPDSGASKRNTIKGFNNILIGHKERDFSTGKIKRLDVLGDVSKLSGKKVLIADDLCSYGGTFLLSANRLKELGAGDVYLLVAHAEKSIVLGEILKPESPIKMVFAANTMQSESISNEKFKVYDIFNWRNYPSLRNP